MAIENQLAIDNYVYVIVALLPLSALILVLQTNPYNALVIRAILGAVAALAYSVLGGADVALTEALVGTMLAVTLYIIAVRSSLIMRLGIIPKNKMDREDYLEETLARIKRVIHKYHLRLELVEYCNIEDLEKALTNKEVHAIITAKPIRQNTPAIYQTAIRVHRLFEILQAESTELLTSLTYVPITNVEEKH